MKKILTYSLNVLLTALIMVSTVGITIHTHYCNTDHSRQQSLFESDIVCHHETGINKCCDNHHNNE